MLGQSSDLLVALRADSAANLAQMAQINREDTAANTEKLMQSMAQMFGMARQESLQREEVLRSEICETAKATSNDATGLAAQVAHLTTTAQHQR